MNEKYEIAINYNGKQAIFHKDNKDNPVSNWYDVIFTNGLIMGESEYYKVMRQDEKEGYISYI